jgi:hypothetical protein
MYFKCVILYELSDENSSGIKTRSNVECHLLSSSSTLISLRYQID